MLIQNGWYILSFGYYVFLFYLLIYRLRKNRQDTGYSTSSSRNSGKQDKSQKREGKKRSSHREEAKRSTSEDERRKKRVDRRSCEKSERKSTKNKNDDDSGKSSNRKFDSDNESFSEELTGSKTVSEGSESESDKKRLIIINITEIVAKVFLCRTKFFVS